MAALVLGRDALWDKFLRERDAKAAIDSALGLADEMEKGSDERNLLEAQPEKFQCLFAFLAALKGRED